MIRSASDAGVAEPIRAHPVALRVGVGFFRARIDADERVVGQVVVIRVNGFELIKLLALLPSRVAADAGQTLTRYACRSKPLILRDSMKIMARVSVWRPVRASSSNASGRPSWQEGTCGSTPLAATIGFWFSAHFIVQARKGAKKVR